MVGDCIMEKGDETLGETLMVGISLRVLAGALAAAAAAAALRFFLPEAAAAADADPCPTLPKPAPKPPTTGPLTMRFAPIPRPNGEKTGEARVFIWAVAVVTTGTVCRGTCEMAKSEPDIPVTCVEVADVTGASIVPLAPDEAAAAAAADLFLREAAEAAAAEPAAATAG